VTNAKILKQQAFVACAICCPQTCTFSLYLIIVINLTISIETLIWMDRTSILPMDHLTKTQKQEIMT
jgi:hypothetical protein